MVARTLAPALLLALAPLACDDNGDDGGADDDSTTGLTNPCDNDDQGDEYAVGLSRMGEQVTVEFVDADPAPPHKGNNAWHVKVTDEAGAPVDMLGWEVIPFMPQHDHGTAVVAEVTPMMDAPGEYMLDPVNLFMSGLWEVTLNLTLPDESKDSVVFRFCVDP